MIQVTSHMRIVVAVEPVDFRNGIDGLARVCKGLTTGRGKDDQTNKPNRPLKQVLGYPLRKDFRRLLQEVR